MKAFFMRRINSSRPATENQFDRAMRQATLIGAAILLSVGAAGRSVAAEAAVPSVREIKESLDAARGLLDEGKPSKAAAKLAEALQGLEAAVGAKGRPPSGLRSLVDRCRELRDDLELEGVDVAALAIPAMKGAAAAEAKSKDSVPAPRPRPGPPAKPAAAAVSFTTQVAPILTRHCGGCHVSGRKGGFQMASFDQLARSGMVQPGVANASRLVEVILSGDMPRGGGKVSPDDLGLLMRWIDSGAPFDGGVEIEIRQIAELEDYGDAVPAEVVEQERRLRAQVEAQQQQ